MSLNHSCVNRLPFCSVKKTKTKGNTWELKRPNCINTMEWKSASLEPWLPRSSQEATPGGHPWREKVSCPFCSVDVTMCPIEMHIACGIPGTVISQSTLVMENCGPAMDSCEVLRTKTAHLKRRWSLGKQTLQVGSGKARLLIDS